MALQVPVTRNPRIYYLTEPVTPLCLATISVYRGAKFREIRAIRF